MNTNVQLFPLSPKDDRYFSRWNVHKSIEINSIEDSRMQTIDLSCQGACLEIPNTLSFSKHLSIIIHLADDMSVEMDAEIVWEKAGTDTTLLGIQFVKPSMESMDLIVDHAFNMDYHRPNNIEKPQQPTRLAYV